MTDEKINNICYEGNDLKKLRLLIKLFQSMTNRILC